jgi:hypothetical protein
VWRKQLCLWLRGWFQARSSCLPPPPRAPRYALQQHGSSTIGAMLGIELDSRGAHKRQDAGSS